MGIKIGIKPALGWLGLVLFATAAQAESRTSLLGPPRTTEPTAHAAAMIRTTPKTIPAPTVTPKTKNGPTPEDERKPVPGASTRR